MARFTLPDLKIERNEDPFEYETEDGSVYTFQDPKRIDPVKIEHSTPSERLKMTIADGKFDEFIAHPEVDLYCFEAVMALYNKHYGIVVG